MRARVDSHRFPLSPSASDGLARLRRAGVAKTLLAGVLLVVAAAAPFAASWHEASVQHVRCAEHGELTHVAVTATAQATAPEQRAGAARVTVNRGDAGTPSGHEHCELAFVAQRNAQPPVVHAMVGILPLCVVSSQPVVTPAVPGRAFLLASAPKTSPPSA